VKAQSAVVAETGNLLALPGRAVDNDAWLIYSKGLTEAGMLAMKAAEEQNKEEPFDNCCGHVRSGLLGLYGLDV